MGIFPFPLVVENWQRTSFALLIQRVPLLHRFSANAINIDAVCVLVVLDIAVHDARISVAIAMGALGMLELPLRFFPSWERYPNPGVPAAPRNMAALALTEPRACISTGIGATDAV